MPVQKLMKVGDRWELLKVPEFAKEATLAEQTIWQMIYSGRLGCVRFGRAVRVPRSELDRLVRAGTTLPRESAMESRSRNMK